MTVLILTRLSLPLFSVLLITALSLHPLFSRSTTPLQETEYVVHAQEAAFYSHSGTLYITKVFLASKDARVLLVDCIVFAQYN